MDILRLVDEITKTQWTYTPREIPPYGIMSREELQVVPLRDRGDGYYASSSGSTGIPVKVWRSPLAKLWWVASFIRVIHWFKLDSTKPLVICKPDTPSFERYPHWIMGQPSTFSSRGPLYLVPQLELKSRLKEIGSSYLYTIPTIYENLDKSDLNILRVILTGEILPDDDPLTIGVYSTNEVGTIAIQCPDNPKILHVMESIGLEILDDNNEPAQAGRVIVTDFTSDHVFRYDIGDYAEWATCSCGRTLPAINRIVGRKRSLITTPSGERIWPVFGRDQFRDIAPEIVQFQIVQRSKCFFTMNLKVREPITKDQEEGLAKLINERLGFNCAVLFNYVSDFGEGKFEEFICKVGGSND